MAYGPAFQLDKIPTDKPMETGLRIITDYFPQTDTQITRFDIKIGKDQYNAAFASTLPRTYQGQSIKADDDLITPKGVECINLKTNKEELIKALKELIGHLEEK